LCVNTEKPSRFLQDSYTVKDYWVAYFQGFVRAILTSTSLQITWNWWRGCTPIIWIQLYLIWRSITPHSIVWSCLLDQPKLLGLIGLPIFKALLEQFWHHHHLRPPEFGRGDAYWHDQRVDVLSLVQECHRNK